MTTVTPTEQAEVDRANASGHHARRLRARPLAAAEQLAVLARRSPRSRAS